MSISHTSANTNCLWTLERKQIISARRSILTSNTVWYSSDSSWKKSPKSRPSSVWRLLTCRRGAGGTFGGSEVNKSGGFTFNLMRKLKSWKIFSYLLRTNYYSFTEFIMFCVLVLFTQFIIFFAEIIILLNIWWEDNILSPVSIITSFCSNSHRVLLSAGQ